MVGIIPMNEQLKVLLAEMAEIRFVIVADYARKFPYRVFDRKHNKTIAQFEQLSEAQSFLETQIERFIKERSNAISATACLPNTSVAFNVQPLLGAVG